LPIKLILVEDHKILCETLMVALNQVDGIEVVSHANDGRKAILLARRLNPDVMLMDVSMPELNGMEACRQVREVSPQTRIIALSAYSDRRYVEGMLKAGAGGYVVKDCTIDELTSAIRLVYQGKTYLSPEVAEVVVGGFVNPDSMEANSKIYQLSPREKEVLQLVAEGRTTKQIAARLNLSEKTIETHRRQLMIKLDLRSIAELTKFAIKEGLTSLDI
jgi:DNA-binding NarL/FixJ family response regulator